MIIKTAKIQKLTRKEWEDENPVLFDGTLVCEKDTERFKIGDGVTPYKDLNYLVDPCVSLMYKDLINKNAIIIAAMILSFIVTAVIFGLLSIIDWVSELKFIWQFIGSGTIYFSLFLLFNRILTKSV